MTKFQRTLEVSAHQSRVSGSAWLKTAQAAKLIGLSPSCLKNYRLNKGWLLEGIHWSYTNAGRRTILYNVELLLDWVATRTEPEQHLRTIEAYLAAQSKRRFVRQRKQQTKRHDG